LSLSRSSFLSERHYAVTILITSPIFQLGCYRVISFRLYKPYNDNILYVFGEKRVSCLLIRSILGCFEWLFERNIRITHRIPILLP